MRGRLELQTLLRVRMPVNVNVNHVCRSMQCERNKWTVGTRRGSRTTLPPVQRDKRVQCLLAACEAARRARGRDARRRVGLRRAGDRRAWAVHERQREARDTRPAALRHVRAVDALRKGPADARVRARGARRARREARELRVQLLRGLAVRELEAGRRRGGGGAGGG